MADPGKQVGEAFIQVGAKGVPEAKAELESLRAELKKVSDELLLLKQSADQAAGVGGSSAGVGTGGGAGGVAGLVTNLAAVRTTIAGLGISAVAKTAFDIGHKIGDDLIGPHPAERAIAERNRQEDLESVQRGMAIRQRGVTPGAEIAAGIQPGRVAEASEELMRLKERQSEQHKRASSWVGGYEGDAIEFATFRRDMAATDQAVAVRSQQMNGLLQRIAPYQQLELQRQMFDSLASLKIRRR